MSRWVSGGAIDAATGEAVAGEAKDPSGVASGKRQAEWSAVSQELEEQRRRREEEARRNAEGGEPSLFAILQANKAAKQAAFEEASKLKNQFRALDDDEVEFLDEIAASKRLEEERTRKEVEDGLGRFRAAQKVGGGGGEAETDEVLGGEKDWGAGGGRKRRRKGDDGRLKGVVRRRTSEGEGGRKHGGDAGVVKDGEKTTVVPVKEKQEVKKPEPVAVSKPGLGLVDYGSDDDSD